MANKCPRCSHGTIEFRQGLAARRVGTYSLAGAQMKASVTTCLIATCTRCDFTAAGYPEDYVYDEVTRTFVAGHFVEDRDLIALIGEHQGGDEQPEGAPPTGHEPHI